MAAKEYFSIAKRHPRQAVFENRLWKVSSKYISYNQPRMFQHHIANGSIRRSLSFRSISDDLGKDTRHVLHIILVRGKDIKVEICEDERYSGSSV